MQLPRGLDGRAAQSPCRLGSRRGAAARGRSVSPWRRRSRQPVVAAEWCLPLVREGGSVVLWVGPSAEPDRVAPAAERVGGALVDRRDGFLVLRKTGPTPPGLPAPAGDGEETAARLRRDAAPVARRPPRPRECGACPPASTRSRTRRAASGRRRPPSTSPPALPRRASARCSSTSTRRRTRPRASASAPTASSTHDLLDGVAARAAGAPDPVRQPRPRPGEADPRRRRGRALGPRRRRAVPRRGARRGDSSAGRT